MTGTLNVTNGDTRPTLLQYQNTLNIDGTATTIDITGNTIICRVATEPTTTILTGTIKNGPKGEVAISFGSLPASPRYLAELVRTDVLGSQTSEVFYITVRDPL